LTFSEGLVVDSKPILVNINITLATLHGQERFPGYVPSFMVPTKFPKFFVPKNELLIEFATSSGDITGTTEYFDKIQNNRYSEN
jgi:hypothetical protein